MILSIDSATIFDPKRRRILLQDLSFSLPLGAKLAIIGPNGAGKSSLVRAIVGLMPMEAERFHLLGESYQPPFSEKIATQFSRKIAFVAQERQLPESMEVSLWCELARAPYHTFGYRLSLKEWELIDYYLERFQLTPFRNRNIASLSGGERQRLFVATAFIQETPLIILDEPNNFLDPKYRTLLNRSVMAEVERKRKSLIAVTHDLNGLTPFTHLLVLKEGRMLYFGAKEGWLNRENLSELYQYPFKEVKEEESGEYFYF